MVTKVSLALGHLPDLADLLRSDWKPVVELVLGELVVEVVVEVVVVVVVVAAFEESYQLNSSDF